MTTSATMPPKKKSKVGRPKSERDDVSIKFDRVLAAKARQVAADQGVTMAEFISEIARPAIEREWQKMVRKMEPEGEK